MDQLFLILAPFLIVDAINPVLLGGTLYALGSHRPLWNGNLVLFSYFVTYLLAGFAIAVSLEYLTEFFHIPYVFDYFLEIIVAILLFYFAWVQKKEGDQHKEKELIHSVEMSSLDALGLGVQINIVGLPFAIPYLAAIDQILKANLTTTAIVFVLFIYNALYILPFFSLIVIRAIYRKESDAIFHRINQVMHLILIKYMPILFVLLGLMLLEDAVSYLLGYREYSFLSLIQERPVALGHMTL